MISIPSPGTREVAHTSNAVGAPPWSTLGWGVFVPAVFVGNVVLAIFAWYFVEWAVMLF
jgi:hypothetical protein